MFEGILPASVAVAAAQKDIADPELFPAEEKVVAQAVEKRRREFSTGRTCARQALAKLGVPPEPIPSGPRGDPRWPAGIVGSITHCDGYRACAVARSNDIAAIGIDAEPNLPLPEGLLVDIALPEERERITVLAGARTDVCWDRLLFSIKESIYKAWFPLAARWLGFEDASVEMDPRRQTFEARFLVPGPILADSELIGLSGSWLVRDDLILTAIALQVGAGMKRVAGC